jgi:hypothetical protein
MGNILGRNEDHLDFNAKHLSAVSTTIPYMRKLQAEADKLVANLEHNNKNFTESDNYSMYKLFQEHFDDTNTDINASSPFISSEMYNYLTKNHKQTGGNITSDIDTEIAQYMNRDFSATSNMVGGNIASNIASNKYSEDINLTATPSLDQQIYSYLNRNRLTGQRGGGYKTISTTTSELRGGMSDEDSIKESLSEPGDEKVVVDEEDDEMDKAVQESVDGESTVEMPDVDVGEEQYNGRDSIESIDSYLSSSAASDSDVLTVGGNNHGGYVSDSDVNTSDINMISVE